METLPNCRLRDEQGPKGGRYVASIFYSGAALWALLTLVWLIRPATSADVCDNEVGLDIMCCWWCAAVAWFTIVPFVSFCFSLIFFLPGYLTVHLIARRVPWWRSVYWIPGWVISGVVAAVLFVVLVAINDWKIIALNIHNGILWQMAVGSFVLMVGLGFFGLLCGICYWLMRDKGSAEGLGPVRP
jgi:hypothetical protein